MRYYDPEQRTNWPLKEPRPKPKPVTKHATGDAAKDGFTAVGPRRPVSALAGDIMDADEAAMHDRWAEDDFFIGRY